MAKRIILEDDEKNQVKILAQVDVSTEDQDWEEKFYQIGCKVAGELAIQHLEDIDKGFYENRPQGFVVKDTRQRTLVTRFGDITFQRRLYGHKEKGYHFLLDEYMNLRPNQIATPSLTANLLDSATRSTYRWVSHEVDKYTAGVISASTVHGLLQRISQEVIQKETERWNSWYNTSLICFPPGERKVSVLYTEADGTNIRLQQEEQKHYELKSGITYEGWELISKVAQEEGYKEYYGLKNKKVYCHGNDTIPFWEGIGQEWDKYWDMGYVSLIVLGGDDASWIDQGVDYIGYCVRQLSGFHLSRACRQGWEKGQELYDAIRTGRLSQTPGTSKERSGKTPEKARKYVLERLEKGVDWRKKVEGQLDIEIPEGARGLGGIEGNQSNLFSDRMKDRGMSWTISGAQHMGKAIQLASNGELKDWCGRRPFLGLNKEEKKDRLTFDIFDDTSQSGYINRASMPVFEGPHGSRPWVKSLKAFIFPYYPLN